MKTKPETPTVSSIIEDSSVSNPAAGSEQAKKPFVEPELSSPVDVLEATTFFQGPESGVTN